MPKETYTATRVKCDRCGTTEDTSRTDTRNEWGEMNINYRGHFGGRGYDGAAGGINRDGTAWLCMSCGHAFMKFMENGQSDKD